ncbi:MAG: DUF222 domain-containing protein [Acidimicrobiales bacterium]|nr:DUF222 domain-containing protein [Acidimicrobiales bacterium]
MILTEQQLAAQRDTANRLVETGRKFAIAHYEIVVGCAEFADGVVWIADGATSAAAWLAERFDVEVCTVRSWISVGRALRGLDATAVAFKTGELSFTKARVLCRLATADNEAELLDIARKVRADRIGQALHAWSLKHEPHTNIDNRHRRARSLRSRTEPEGTIATSLRLPPLHAGVLDRAVEAQVMRRKLEREADGTWPTLAQQRADALVELLTANANHRFEILIHVDHEGCRFPDGTPLTDSAVTGLLDQATIRLIIHDTNNRPVNASDARRKPTIRQKRTIQTQQPTCTRCGTTQLPNLHHTTPHAQSKRTTTGQLEHLCAPCHRAEHQRHPD